MRILTLAGKDLKQLFQNKQTAIFLLLMPVLFTTMFGFMFGGFSAGDQEDTRTKAPTAKSSSNWSKHQQ